MPQILFTWNLNGGTGGGSGGTSGPPNKSMLNVTTASVIKSGTGNLTGIQVLVAGSAPGSANDAASTAGANAANQMTIIPNLVGPVSMPTTGIPFVNGLAVSPGAGQTLAITYQ